MLSLRSGESSLVLAPAIGGAIVGWTFGAVPVLRRPSPDAIVSGNVRGLACFPLVPYSNLIAYGRLHWDGTDHLLTAISVTIRTPSTASGGSTRGRSPRSVRRPPR
jgi:aldose 1-epimerase